MTGSGASCARLLPPGPIGQLLQDSAHGGQCLGSELRGQAPGFTPLPSPTPTPSGLLGGSHEYFLNGQKNCAMVTLSGSLCGQVCGWALLAPALQPRNPAPSPHSSPATPHCHPDPRQAVTFTPLCLCPCHSLCLQCTFACLLVHRTNSLSSCHLFSVTFVTLLHLSPKGTQYPPVYHVSHWAPRHSKTQASPLEQGHRSITRSSQGPQVGDIGLGNQGGLPGSRDA